MHIEYELKYFSNVDSAYKILKQNAQLVHPRTLMKRVYLQDTFVPDRWIRIRDEGSCVKVTFKKNNHQGKIDSVSEIEMQVFNFEHAQDFFLALGYVSRMYVETYRETWSYENTMITLDTWPGIPQFLEIEGNDAQDVYRAAFALGYSQESENDMHKNKDGIVAHMKEVYCKFWNISLEQFKTITYLTFENVETIKRNLEKNLE